MKNLIGIFFSLIVGCTHKVHKLDVALEEKESMIDQVVSEVCGDHCRRNNCWWETKNVIFCNISFSFVADYHKAEFLKSVVNKIDDKNMSVGFCGRNSLGTVMTGALIGALIGGAASSVAGGDISMGTHIGAQAGGASTVLFAVNIVDESDVEDDGDLRRLMNRACTSTPVEET